MYVLIVLALISFTQLVMVHKFHGILYLIIHAIHIQRVDIKTNNRNNKICATLPTCSTNIYFSFIDFSKKSLVNFIAKNHKKRKKIDN